MMRVLDTQRDLDPFVRGPIAQVAGLMRQLLTLMEGKIAPSTHIEVVLL